jgi:purine-binding chemotaxis protein CheW
MANASVVEETNRKNLEQYQGKYLTFKLANEEYGLEIMKVREIIGIMDITKLPKTPDFVKGVINLRGKVIPVVDLRLKFGLEEVDYTDKTCIIVVEIGSDGEAYQMGIIVDAVSEVMNVSVDEIEPTPRFGVAVNTEYILGMAKGKDSVRTLLDIDKVLGSEEIAAMTSAL